MADKKKKGGVGKFFRSVTAELEESGLAEPERSEYLYHSGFGDCGCGGADH